MEFDFLIKNPSDYPFSGKAYSEDLYYCSIVRDHARFAALSKARCAHIDFYEIKKADNISRLAYIEGVNDAKIRIFIAKNFRQYSVPMTAMHILWVGCLGVVFGSASLDRTAFMLGIGRITGLMKSTGIKK